MKITLKYDSDIYSTLNFAGKSFTFDFSDERVRYGNYLLLPGDTGIGKSTLVNTIRSFQCDNVDEKENKDFPKLGYSSIKSYIDHVKIETDFKKFFFLSSAFDDPMSYENSADASYFFIYGGYQSKHMSTGEKSLFMLNRFLKFNMSYFDNDTLVVLDEADSGLSLKYQIGFYKLLENTHIKTKANILTISHSLFLAQMAYDVYDLKKNDIVKGTDYLLDTTGYSFGIPVRHDL